MWEKIKKITEVVDCGDHYTLSCEEIGLEPKVGDTIGLGFDKKYGEPKIGDTLEIRVKGASLIAGLKINGEVVFDKTDDEIDSEHAAMIAAKDAQDREAFEKNRTQLDADYESLPDIFKQRIDRFRGNNPDFRWKYEGYEMFCCKQALILAEELKTVDALKEFHAMDYEDQRKRVPALSDQHSGNTFGCSCSLAAWWIQKPENVIKLHGALAPLVGSKEYGCVPRDA